MMVLIFLCLFSFQFTNLVCPVAPAFLNNLSSCVHCYKRRIKRRCAASSETVEPDATATETVALDDVDGFDEGCGREGGKEKAKMGRRRQPRQFGKRQNRPGLGHTHEVKVTRYL